MATSVPSSTTWVQYVLGSNPQTLTVPFVFQSSSDLLVLDSKTSPPTTLTLNSDYSVTGGGGTIGTITTIPGGSNSVQIGDTITISRRVPLTQLVDGPPLTPAILLAALDKQTEISQQINLLAGNSLQFQGDESPNPAYSVLPLTNRKNAFLAFDGSGHPWFPTSASIVTNTDGAVSVDSIAALKLLVVAQIPNNYPILVLGYYAAGDGGGGFFRYSSADADAEIQGMRVAPTVGSGRWLRLTDGQPINIRWTGAKIDSNAAGSSGTDDTVAIQTAIDLGAYGLVGVKPGTCAFHPGGFAKTTNSLFIGYPQPSGVSYSFVTGGLIGIGSQVAAGYGSSIVSVFPNKDRPAICIESGRQSTVIGISLLGNGVRPVDAIGPGSGALRNYFWDQSNWEDPVVAAQPSDQRRYAPFSGVVQNAYSRNISEGASPYPYPAVSIPSYLVAAFNNLTSVTYGNFVSAGMILQDVGAVQYDVGVLCNAYSSFNGDQNIFDNLHIYGCTYGVSTTQPNQRRFVVRNSNISFCWVGATDNTHGVRNSGIEALQNVEIDYNAFVVRSSANTLLRMQNLRGEGGGCLGYFKDVTMRSVNWQQLTFNNYTCPLIFAEGAADIEGLNIGGSVTSDRANYMATTFPIPYLIVSRTLRVANCFVYAQGINEFPYPANQDAFFADMQAYSVATNAQENQILAAFQNTVWPGLVWAMYNQNAATANSPQWGPGLYIAARNRAYDGENYAWTANAGTLSNRCGSPVGFKKFQCLGGAGQNHGGKVDLRNNLLLGDDVGLASFTISETLQTVVVDGQSCGFRQLYATIVQAQNGFRYLFRKGAAYQVVLGSAPNFNPVVMVCVKNPTDTGVANQWVFKIICGYDGRSEFASGLSWPGSGAVLSAGGSYASARASSYWGPIFATFAAGDATVTIDTSYGIDATKLFVVGDVVFAADPRVLAAGGLPQEINPTHRVASITNAGEIELSSNAAANATCELWIN